MPVTKSLEDLDAERASLMERLILELAVSQGLDVAEGIAPDQHRFIANEAELVYEDWCERAFAAAAPQRSDGSPIQLAELYELDDLVYAMVEGRRVSDEPLQ